MEEQGKASIRTQYQTTDGKIVSLQADPECREMSRLVADVNRRVLRVQAHGTEGEGRQRRGFGVEVAREAADEPAAAGGSASGGPRFYEDGDEPARQDDPALVERYLEDVEVLEGKPGPVQRTVRRWVYGAPAAKESCSCRQVQAVAGKMTIAEASGLQDEAVDRLLLQVYFHPEPKREVARRLLHRASEVSKRVSERVKTAARRVSRRYTEYRERKSGSTRGDAGPEADTVQLRRRPTGGAPRPGEDGEAPQSSEEQLQLHSAGGSEEAAGGSVGVYRVALDGGSAQQWPGSGPAAGAGADSPEGLSGARDRRQSLMQDYSLTNGAQAKAAGAHTNSEQETTMSESSDPCICPDEKSKSPEPGYLTVKDSANSGTRIGGEERQQQIEASEPKADLQPPESDQLQNRGGERRIVGSLDLYILNHSSEFDWEPVPEDSEEVSLASQPIGAEESEEDSPQNNEDSK